MDVEFIPATNSRHTPDIKYRGLEWEIKRQNELIRGKHRIIIITKTHKVIELFN